MLLHFFTALRDAKVPVTLREHLMLLDALERDLADKRVEEFYLLARAALVKDERHLDRFDRVFGTVFKGIETLGEATESMAIPRNGSASWRRSISPMPRKRSSMRSDGTSCSRR